MLDQYDRLRKRNAFLEQYKKEDMFSGGLEEFDESRCVEGDLCSASADTRRVVAEMTEWVSVFAVERGGVCATLTYREYLAMEKPDYVDYGT